MPAQSQAQNKRVSVIVCAYTEERWSDLVATIDSLQRQEQLPHQIIVVVDHNPALLARARGQWPTLCCVENQGQQGLSGARNSGIAAATGEIIAFLDDDAQANPAWLAQVQEGYANPQVMGVGGAIVPCWATTRPGWFPSEFDWVVGCTYRGMPTKPTPVRNLIGCNMSFRATVFAQIGGFRIGRVGALSIGQENDETELCIRLRQAMPTAHLLYTPAAWVGHKVHPHRATFAYFVKRCYSEGISKAALSQLVGRQQSLASERRYTLQVLPQGVVEGLRTALQGQRQGVARAVVILLGLAITSLGYLLGSLVERGRAPAHTMPARETQASLDMPRATQATGAFQPARLFEIELSQPLPALSTTDPATARLYRRGLALVRLHSQPLGMVELPLPPQGLEPIALAQYLWRALGEQLVAHCQAEGLPAVTHLPLAGLPAEQIPHTVQARNQLLEQAPFVSVVVATHNRPESLRITLDSLLAQRYPAFEIVVVDSAPSSRATAELIRTHYQPTASGHSVRYVYEARPGLALAHNAGLKVVSAPIVAFTDDDVRVDDYWLAELVRGFSHGDKVGCVTGMIFPAELETPAQGWIEQFGFSKGFTQRLYDLSVHRPANPLHPYTAGTFGSGANMAFRTASLRAIGGFDPALGAGSKALGGDDLEAFFQIIVHGYQLVYNPAAIIHHWHRRDYAGLCRQAYGYGVSLTAYLTKTLWERPARLLDFLVRMPYGLFFAFHRRSPKHQKKQADYPRELTWLEYKGMAYGPFAYLYSRWHTAKLVRSGAQGIGE